MGNISPHMTSRQIRDLYPAACGMSAPLKIAVRHQEYPGHSDLWHRHCGFYELVLVLGGSARNETTDGSLLLQPGNLLLFRPGSVHHFCAIRKFKHYNLFFTADVLKGTLWDFSAFPCAQNFFTAPEPVSPLYMLDETFFPQTVVMLDHLRREFLRRSDGWHESMFFDFGQLMIFLLRNCMPVQRAAASTDWRIAEAVRFMEDSLPQPLSMKAVAQYANMSESSFRLHFREIIGCSPIEYLIRLRLKRALLLLSMETPVTLAALQAGFSDLNYFCRQFRQHFGVSARIYLQKLQQPDFDLNTALHELMQEKE